ncbi:MAG: glucosaminidase domain-containing protein [Bacteroidales bacterium]|nr:glucosaminidase domain-containing protein [Bacteroidales bacterium]
MKTFDQISSGLRGAAGYIKVIRDLKYKLAANRSATRSILLCMVFFLGSPQVPGGSPLMTEEMKYQVEKSFFYFQVRYEPFSEELLKKSLEYEGVLYQDIVLLQSQLETGHYTSDIFLNGNNLFGMKYPSYRPTVATGTYKEHAKYAHWSDSVIDYTLWQKYYLSRGYRLEGEIDSDFYLVFLKCIPYAEDSRYVSKLVTMSRGDLT